MTDITYNRTEHLKEISQLGVQAHWRNHIKPTPEQNKYILRANKMNSAARKAGIKGRVTPGDLKRVVESTDGKCADCGSDQFVVYAHPVLFSNGGKNTKENLTLRCRKCVIKHKGLL